MSSPPVIALFRDNFLSSPHGGGGDYPNAINALPVRFLTSRSSREGASGIAADRLLPAFKYRI